MPRKILQNQGLIMLLGILAVISPIPLSALTFWLLFGIPYVFLAFIVFGIIFYTFLWSGILYYRWKNNQH